MAHSALFRSSAAFLGLLAAVAFAETVEQKYDDGTLKVKYQVDADGKKDGLFEEFYPTGKVKQRVEYKAGTREGKYATFHSNGRIQATGTYQNGKRQGIYSERTEKGQPQLLAHYKDGKLDGVLTRYQDGQPVFVHSFKDGQPVFPRSPKDIKDKLKKILGPPAKGKDEASQRQAALRRLKAYRYLAGVPYEKLVLDDEYNRQAQAATRLCDKLKRLSHDPPNAGLPEEEYQLAKAGTRASNLGGGFTRIADSLDYFMTDSDDRNVTALGHRRWCIHPYMGKTGFGITGTFTAMYAIDGSAEEVPDFDAISWPPAGFTPIEMFGRNSAWNVSLNPKKFALPDDKAQASLFAVDAQLNKVGEPVKLGMHQFNNQLIGLPYCFIFRPEKPVQSPGKRFLVEVTGLKSVDGKTPRPLSFVVVFMSLK